MIWKSILARLGRKPPEDSSSRDKIANQEAPDPSNKDHGRPIELVIGLDFGTSFSKVVVGESRVHYAVPFDGYEVGKNSLLLPSALCVLSDTGKCLLGTDQHDGYVFDNLKMPLIERNFTIDVQARAAAYLALVLRHTRNWLSDTHGSTYKNRKLEWFINVGLPTDSYDDEELKSIYRVIVRTAWRASVLPGDIIFSKVLALLGEKGTLQDNLQQDISELELPEDRVHTFPEFCAQLTGYVRSPRRQDGLHVAVDVGGGTLDVTVFNVHTNNGEDVYPIFARQVKPLGVRYLVEARLQALNLEREDQLSPFDNLPSDAVFRNRFGITRDQLENTDKAFRDRVLDIIIEALRYTKRYRYPTAPQWDRSCQRYEEPLPSFFCGGGVLSNFYGDLLQRFAEYSPPCKLSASQLPVPDDFSVSAGITPKDFARLAVAYGLSFNPFDIGQIRQMNEVEDRNAETVQLKYEVHYIGKEQM